MARILLVFGGGWGMIGVKVELGVIAAWERGGGGCCCGEGRI